MSSEASLTLTLDNRDEAVLLFGNRDQHLRLIRDALEVRLIARGNTIQVDGADYRVAEADRVFQQLRQMLRQQGKISLEDVRTVLAIVQQGSEELGERPVTFIEGSRHVRPRTDGQARYVRAMRENDLALCIGPGGTGKTYLGVAMAVSLLRQGQVKRIVLVRPADEGQNTTIAQMKMFLTRMGTGSKIIVTGDVTQVDLPKQTHSGLIDAIQRLRDIDRIAIVHLDESDIVRHPLVQQVVRAYEEE